MWRHGSTRWVDRGVPDSAVSTALLHQGRRDLRLPGLAGDPASHATVTWPLYGVSHSGLPSQFGQITGLTGLGSPGHAEVTPYVVTKSVPDLGAGGLTRENKVT